MSKRCRKCVICKKQEYKSGDDKIFFSRFPRDERRCREWVKLVGNPELVFLPIEQLNKVRYICGDHFDNKSFNKKRNRLRKTAVPKLKLTAQPLSDEQLMEFPFHMWNYRKEQIPDARASTSQASQLTIQKENEQIPDVRASTSQASQSTIQKENEQIPDVRASTSQVSQSSIQKENEQIPDVRASTSQASQSSIQKENEQIPDVRASTSQASQSTIQKENEQIPDVRASTSQASQSSIQKENEQIPDVRASTSQASQSSIQKENEQIPDVRASTSQASQSSIQKKNEQIPDVRASTSQASQSSIHKENEMTPRKKKLIQALRKTKCTLKSLRRSANLIEKIDSPMLRDMVISACKNQNLKSTGRRWTTRTKLSCLAILKRSAKTYRYLSDFIPMPSVRTLQNVLKKIPMEPGINKAVLNHLKAVGHQKDLKEKVCALLFDEMALKRRLIYNQGTDQVEGFQDLGTKEGEEGRSSDIADHALVFLLQGIYRKYKQPIAFYFVKGTISSEKLAAIIKEIIAMVFANGYQILTTVCDQGPTNMGALKLLKRFSCPSGNTSENSFYFNGQEIYIMYDIPHLFKSIRNNFLKNGTLMFDGKIAKWSHLVRVEEKNRNFLYLSKISPTHIAPKYRAKMRVKYAAQVLSNTVAAVLKLLAEAEKSSQQTEELMSTALVVQDLDRLFDYTNGPSSADDIKKGLRQNVSLKTDHLEEWAKFEKKIQTMRFINEAGTVASSVKCVQGYIISLKSLRGIWQVVNNLGFKYLNLRQLNQDALENLFGIIRQHSPTNSNPTCAHFMAALKTSIVTGLTAPHSRGSNCQKDNNTLLTDFHNLVFGPKIDCESNIREVAAKDFVVTETGHCSDDVPVLTLAEDEIELEDNLAEISEQPVVYISGYLVSKLLKNHRCKNCQILLTEMDPNKLSDDTYNYISLREWWKNKISLTYPSKKLCLVVQNATAIVENEICPILHQSNICQMAVTLFMTKCDLTWFDCSLHKDIVFEQIYSTLGQLLIRRQCQRLNQGIALQEEAVADIIKISQQQGKAK